MAKSKATLLAALLAGGLMGCDTYQEAKSLAQSQIRSVMDRHCETMDIETRKAAYAAFADKRLLPFDCDLDGERDF